MYTLIISLMVLTSLLMIGIVLIQESKGGGLASGFASGNEVLGVRKTTDFIEKATWTLAIAMVVFSVLSVAFLPKSNAGQDLIENTMPLNPSTSAGNTQSFPASGQSSEGQQKAAPAKQAPSKSNAPAKQATPAPAKNAAPATEAPANAPAR